jgi:hypothetical protein
MSNLSTPKMDIMELLLSDKELLKILLTNYMLTKEFLKDYLLSISLKKKLMDNSEISSLLEIMKNIYVAKIFGIQMLNKVIALLMLNSPKPPPNGLFKLIK